MSKNIGFISTRFAGTDGVSLKVVYFRKPILTNRYEVFIRDIEPQGFDLIVMDGFLSKARCPPQAD
jgi:hypothetical protein